MAFPALLLISLIGTVAGSLLTNPTPQDVSIEFYARVRPWGFWGPIRAAAIARDASCKPNRDFYRDLFNVAVGIVWQTALVALPIYVVIRDSKHAVVCLAIVLFTSAILKHTWYDRLPRE